MTIMVPQHDNITKSRIGKAILEFSPMITLNNSTRFDDVRRIIRDFMRKHPEIFWFSNQYRYYEKTGILKFRYNFTREKADFFKCEIEKVIKDDFRIEHVKTLSEIDRLSYVYKWIANRTTYNEYSSFNQTIYSVLVNRNSVCTGYAKTAQYLLGLVGIESYLMFGKFHADKSEHGRHGWNIVNIGSKWYHVDFCLADSSLVYLLNNNEPQKKKGSILWNYFGVPTEMILQNRSIELKDTLPECKDILSDCHDIELLRPSRQFICCKSDSGTSSRIYLNSFNKNTVLKVPRKGQSGLLHNEVSKLAELSGCPHIIKSYGLSDNGLELEQLTPWSELLNSHYYNPDEDQLKDILIQLTKGLIECRNKGLTYYDIHYNNVFVTKDGTYKWGDFGIAYRNTDEKLPPEMIREDGKPKGSYWFMAPETYHQKVFFESSAIYSVAMLAYFVMNGMRPPFWIDKARMREALSLRFNGENIPHPVFVDRFRNLWPIVRKALSYSIGSRPLSFDGFLCQLNSGATVTEDHIQKNESDYELRSTLDSSVLSTTSVDCSADDASASTPDRRWGDGGIHDTDSFACTAAIPGNTKRICQDDFAATDINPKILRCPSAHSAMPERPFVKETYGVIESETKGKRSIWKKLFGKKEKSEAVNASAYAPAEIIPYRHFLVRVFIHRPEDSDPIDQSVKDVDKKAVKKANKPLEIPVKDGDKITIQLTITAGVTIDEPIQSTVWRGRYVECDFGCELTDRYLSSMLGKAIIAINNVPCGDLKFTIDVISEEKPKVYAPVETHRYSKIFISYAHADYLQVRGIAEGCKMNGADYFFDRHTLQAGDIFKDRILQYIDNADLFVLCWSKNAAESEWVRIERKHALDLIERGNRQLTIYPLSLPPEAPLPPDMSDKYNFGTL